MRRSLGRFRPMPQPTKRFRLEPIEGPAATDPLESRYRYDIDVELDPGAPFQLEKCRLLIFFDDLDLRLLAEGHPADVESAKRAAARVGYYAISKLSKILAAGPPERSYRLSPTAKEIEQLSKVDPARVRLRDWLPVEPRPTRPTERVFISCGQRTPDEIRLGETIAQLVREHAGLEGYFAQYQQSLEGLTDNIFNAINRAAAFVAVMHRRDPVAEGVYRGSVWV